MLRESPDTDAGGLLTVVRLWETGERTGVGVRVRDGAILAGAVDRLATGAGREGAGLLICRDGAVDLLTERFRSAKTGASRRTRIRPTNIATPLRCWEIVGESMMHLLSTNSPMRVPFHMYKALHTTYVTVFFEDR